MNPTWAAVMLVGLMGCQTTDEKQVKIETQVDKVSYAIGLNIGNNIKRDSVTFNPEILLRGIMDASVDSAKRLMTDSAIAETMMAFQTEMQNRRAEIAHKASEKNRAEGEAYLAVNAKKPGVVTRPSGLQYRVIAAGKGKKPSATSTVTVHYAGRLIDGTEFDSSVKHGQPATFPLSNVMQGWNEALQLMPAGSKWELVIPPALAYGDQGAGGVIPPSAVLIFEIELLSIQ